MNCCQCHFLYSLCTRFWKILHIWGLFSSDVFHPYYYIAQSFPGDSVRLFVMDARERREWARPAVLSVFPITCFSLFSLLRHIAFQHITSPTWPTAPGKLSGCAEKQKQVVWSAQELHVSDNGADFIKGSKKDHLLVMHRLRATVLPREGSLSSECEESVVPSYLQATGKLSLWLSGRPFTLLLCVCVCSLVILYGKKTI